MRIAFERAIVPELEPSGRAPSLQMVGELERAVLHKLCVKSAVRGEVDVFYEDTVHGRLDRCQGSVHTELHNIGSLGIRRYDGHGRCKRQKESYFHQEKIMHLLHARPGGAGKRAADTTRIQNAGTKS